MARQEVWKYEVLVADDRYVMMPEGANILTVQMQRDEPYVWALVDPDQRRRNRHFVWRGTGYDASGLEQRHYVGTVQTSDGLVLHLFDLGHTGEG